MGCLYSDEALYDPEWYELENVARFPELFGVLLEFYGAMEPGLFHKKEERMFNAQKSDDGVHSTKKYQNFDGKSKFCSSLKLCWTFVFRILIQKGGL